ncbi:MAG: DNA mismatch repair protein MutS, partial [Clostridia bacterium]
MTPMLEQYTKIKNKYPKEILFYRLGDFYEMFMEDAELASRELEITLTARDSGKGKKVPMCGIPYHAVNVYLGKLLAKGYHVAICEQVEDPKMVKGIVKREVVRIVTPGTIIEESFLEAGKNNFLCAIATNAGIYGLAYVDLSTGEFSMTEFSISNGERQLQNELARLQAVECVYQSAELWSEELLASLATYTSLTPFVLSAELKDELRENALYQRELTDNNLFNLTNSTAKEAAKLALAYLLQTQKRTLVHVNHVEIYDTGIYLAIDRGTRRNLELNANLFGSNEKANLLAVMDKTITAAGGRKLRQWLEQPLALREEIEKRLAAVTEMLETYVMREEIKAALQSMYDLQRLVSRCALGTAGPKELIMLSKSLSVIANCKKVLFHAESVNLVQISETLVPLLELQNLLSSALNQEALGTLREGNVFKVGFHPLIDKLKTAKTEGKKLLAALEEKERTLSGIKNLKVSYNKIFGYYFEITNSNLKNIPPHFIRKQTLANCERFCTEELKELEELVLNSEEKLLEVEKELFAELVKQVLANSDLLQLNATLLAELDIYLSFAELAYQNNYTLPSFRSDNSLLIVGGRHPVIEKLMPNGSFIANDCQLHLPEQPYFALVTGPNMAGKSTYIRMVAVMAIMAQMGSYVPADRYEAGVVDKVFARVGAADDLSSGQSTFMVEM